MLHPDSFSRSLTVTLLASMALFVMACATLPDSGHDYNITLKMLERDLMEYQGSILTGRQTGRRLRSQGVPPGTTLKILTSPGVSKDDMATLHRRLQRYGYQRIVFASERHIEVQQP